jgi:hypothetical protein
MQKVLFNLLLKQQPKQQKDGGYIIVVVMGMVVAMSSMLLTAALTSKVDSNSTRASGNSAGGFYAAEAGLNVRAKDIRSKFVGYNLPSGTSPTNITSCQGASSPGTGDFALNTSLSVQDPLNSSDSTKRIPIATYVVNANRMVSGNPVPTSVTINTGEQFAGLNAQEYRYDVTSIACDRTNQPTASLSMRFKSRLVPLFQFAAFYNKDLEILPGPNMTLSGPVHTNGDLYLNSGDSGARLTIRGQVSTVGGLYRGRKNTNECTQTVVIDNGSGGTPSADCVAGQRTQITDVSRWNNQVRIGIPRLTVPPAETLDPSSTAQYWSKADLRVVLKLDSSNSPTAIEIRNVDNSVDTIRTNKLRNDCPVPNTTLKQAVTSSSEVALKVNSSSSFRVNDRLIIGDDFDNNAIYHNGTVSSSPSAPINPQANDLTPALLGDTINLRRQLGSIPTINTSVRKAVVSTSDTFFNGREGKTIRMLDVDVQGLLDCIHDENLQDSSRQLNDTTEGGLVWYFTVDGPDSNRLVYGPDDKSYNTDNTPYQPPARVDGNNYGVRLYNGNTLQSTISGASEIKGLTVVTDQALYVRGHYNCGATSTATSNTLPTCTYKKPAAFLADTINILSENWRMSDADSQSYSSSNLPTGLSGLNNRSGRNTNINAAFLAGTDTTGSGQEGPTGQGTTSSPKQYNGGLENYPRFHEDWSPEGTIPHTTLIYRGSFVSLGRPRRVDGNWSIPGVDYYGAPRRNWDYDTDFNNADLLPPLSPRFVYLRQERFSRSYDRVSSLPISQTFATLFPRVFVPVFVPHNFFRF